MFIVIGSGVMLALAYDINNPSDALQVIMLSNPGATFIRGIHHWSAQFFFVLMGLHFADQLSRNGEREITPGSWLQLCLIVPTLIFLMISGFILKGDRAGVLARDVLAGLLDTVPVGASILKFLLLGNSHSVQIIYVHHIATGTLILLMLSLRHGERVWPEPRSALYVLGFSMVFAAFFTPALNAETSGTHVRGPWYFVGLQEILHWTSRPVWVIIIGMAAFVLLLALPFVPKGWSGKIKCGLVICFMVYLSLIVIGVFFRGSNWEPISPFDLL